jgi:NCS1 family nucleobase:cation symporter-1
MVGLFPKYISIRRGVMITTVIAGWIMVPWKIIHSAASLLSFMSGLAIFLAPIAAILASDYWVVKKKAVDVPSLYRKHGRYYYRHGCNWRAAVAFVISVTPNIPGLAHAVNSSVKLSGGIQHIYDMNYLFGFTSAFVVYVGLSYIYPPEGVKIPHAIHEEIVIIDGKEVVNDGLHTPNAGRSETGSLDEKRLAKTDVEVV